MILVHGKNMNFKNVKLFRNTFSPIRNSSAEYSRKNNPNHEKFYKVVTKVNNAARENSNSALIPIPNWEILKPQGYRFFLPGHVGPGWHDTRSNPHSLPKEFDLAQTSFKCYAQHCPVLLRQNVSELFPGIDFSYSNLTVISLLHGNLKVITDGDVEVTTKTFVLVAQNICKKLRNAGYWSDFINPLSGLPGVSTYNHDQGLYATDPRFRSVGFRISERQNCLIIEEKKSFQFRGNLFTTAPVSSDVVQQLLSIH